MTITRVCECGHLESSHSGAFCEDCCLDAAHNGSLDDYHEFVPDNLRTLEKASEEPK